jgi:H+/Cl- antiporter ClcA
LLEAGWLWGRSGYELSWTLGNNFSLAALDVGVPPAWQVLAFGLVFVLVAFGSDALRVRALAPEPAGSGHDKAHLQSHLATNYCPSIIGAMRICSAAQD